jgi:hypothetical protein
LLDGVIEGRVARGFMYSAVEVGRSRDGREREQVGGRLWLVVVKRNEDRGGAVVVVVECVSVCERTCLLFLRPYHHHTSIIQTLSHFLLVLTYPSNQRGSVAASGSSSTNSFTRSKRPRAAAVKMSRDIFWPVIDYIYVSGMSSVNEKEEEQNCDDEEEEGNIN